MFNLTAQQLRKAAGIKEKIASLQNELQRILGATVPPSAASKGKRKMSTAARARIAAAQRARWAKQRRSKPARPARKPKRKVSAAARARLAELAKARWAKAKAAGKKTL